MKILFICTGNTCRSPLAELYVAHQLAGLPVEVASAGLATWGGSPISAASRHILDRYGIDASAFRSRVVTPEMLFQSDLIIAVSEAHRARLLQIAPQKETSIRLLSEFSGGNYDIPDPYGGDQASYDKIFAVMKPSLDGVVAFVKGRL